MNKKTDKNPFLFGLVVLVVVVLIDGVAVFNAQMRFKLCYFVFIITYSFFILINLQQSIEEISVEIKAVVVEKSLQAEENIPPKKS